MYSQVLQAQHDNPDLLEEVGFFEAQAGRFPEAIGLMKLALKFRPNDPTSHLITSPLSGLPAKFNWMDH